MNWRNPAIELPKDKDVVWCMLEPHKERGSLLDSAQSIQIICGEFRYYGPEDYVVNNCDELGMGSIDYDFSYMPKDGYYNGNGVVMAWLPLEEMVLPKLSEETT